MHKIDIVFLQHLDQQRLKRFSVNRTSKAAQSHPPPTGVVFQQDNRGRSDTRQSALAQTGVHALHTFAEGLSGHEIGVDERHFIGVLNSKINVLRLSQAILS